MSPQPNIDVLNSLLCSFAGHPVVARPRPGLMPFKTFLAEALGDAWARLEREILAEGVPSGTGSPPVGDQPLWDGGQSTGFRLLQITAGQWPVLEALTVGGEVLPGASTPGPEETGVLTELGMSAPSRAGDVDQPGNFPETPGFSNEPAPAKGEPSRSTGTTFTAGAGPNASLVFGGVLSSAAGVEAHGPLTPVSQTDAAVPAQSSPSLETGLHELVNPGKPTTGAPGVDEIRTRPTQSLYTTGHVSEKPVVASAEVARTADAGNSGRPSGPKVRQLARPIYSGEASPAENGKAPHPQPNGTGVTEGNPAQASATDRPKDPGFVAQPSPRHAGLAVNWTQGKSVKATAGLVHPTPRTSAAAEGNSAVATRAGQSTRTSNDFAPEGTTELSDPPDTVSVGQVPSRSTEASGTGTADPSAPPGTATGGSPGKPVFAADLAQAVLSMGQEVGSTAHVARADARQAKAAAVSLVGGGIGGEEPVASPTSGQTGSPAELGAAGDLSFATGAPEGDRDSTASPGLEQPRGGSARVEKNLKHVLSGNGGESGISTQVTVALAEDEMVAADDGTKAVFKRQKPVDSVPTRVGRPDAAPFQPGYMPAAVDAVPAAESVGGRTSQAGASAPETGSLARDASLTEPGLEPPVGPTVADLGPRASTKSVPGRVTVRAVFRENHATPTPGSPAGERPGAAESTAGANPTPAVEATRQASRFATWLEQTGGEVLTVQNGKASATAGSNPAPGEQKAEARRHSSFLRQPAGDQPIGTVGGAPNRKEGTAKQPTPPAGSERFARERKVSIQGKQAGALEQHRVKAAEGSRTPEPTGARLKGQVNLVRSDSPVTNGEGEVFSQAVKNPSGTPAIGSGMQSAGKRETEAVPRRQDQNTTAQAEGARRGQDVFKAPATPKTQPGPKTGTADVSESVRPGTFHAASASVRGKGTHAGETLQTTARTAPDPQADPVFRQLRSHLVSRRLTADGDRVVVQLKPPELGRIRIRVETHGHVVRAIVESDSSATRELLHDNLQQLVQTLNEKGLRVHQVQVLPFPDRSGGFDQGQQPNDRRSASEWNGGEPGREAPDREKPGNPWMGNEDGWLA